jgi:flagellar basal body L-ring protein FlgH
MIAKNEFRLGTKDLIRFAVLCLLAVGALAGCAGLEQVTEVKPAPVAPVARKIAAKELGSLWSEDSLWNHMYSASAARVTGDMITIKLDESFRKRIATYKVVDEKEAVKAKEAAEKAASETKGDRKPAAVAAVPPKEEGPTGPLILKGNIEEVGQRGVYRIVASDSLQLGDWEPNIILKGRVRDRDITVNDEIEVASIAELTLEVSTGAPVVSDEERRKNVSW